MTMAADLHEKAVEHARSSHYTDFSGLVTKLLVADLRAHAPTQQTYSEDPVLVAMRARADQLKSPPTGQKRQRPGKR